MKKIQNVLIATIAIVFLANCGGGDSTSSATSANTVNAELCCVDGTIPPTGKIVIVEPEPVSEPAPEPKSEPTPIQPTAYAGSDRSAQVGEVVVITGKSSNNVVSCHWTDCCGKILVNGPVLEYGSSISGDIQVVFVVKSADGLISSDTAFLSFTPTLPAKPTLPPTPDTVPPVITITGGTTAMTVGGTYTPPTVTAMDDVDGDISSAVVKTGDTVNPNAVGTYTEKYDVKDAAGNQAAQKTHTVVVSAAPPTNNIPTCEDFTVYLGYVSTGTKDLTPLMHDVDSGDTLAASYAGSGVLAGDLIISYADVVANEAIITASSGGGNAYVDYTVFDGKATSATCRVTFNEVDPN